MSKVNRRTFLKAAGIGGAAVAAAPTVIVKPARADTIRVGGLHDRTGVIGIYGNEMADALVFAVDEINAAGGVLGQQLELIEYDAQSTMANYSQYAQRLATSDQVDVIFGGITSASRESIRPVFDRFRKLTSTAPSTRAASATGRSSAMPKRQHRSMARC
ncbi:MAG: transporter substrate-binding protein [Rhodospirillaceae bacterium]|nr:transporter substrate-binding protein [Rhodospirillaceae bacterium]